VWDLDIDGRMILNWILNKYVPKALTRFIWHMSDGSSSVEV